MPMVREPREEQTKQLLDLVDLFIENETAMHRYYEVCATRFSESGAVFSHLARQEAEHADLFRKVRASIEEKPELWSLGRYHPQTVRVTMNEVQGQIREIVEGRTNRFYAVTFIRDVEQSLIESDLANAFETSLQDMRSRIVIVQNQTLQPRDTLAALVERLRL